jgi:hypothetical protein
MSVTELQARIAKLSADIALQKEVAKQFRDPVARLPLELSSEIFHLCLPPFSIRPTLGTHNISMLLQTSSALVWNSSGDSRR